jgi:hypothetical protein
LDGSDQSSEVVIDEDSPEDSDDRNLEQTALNRVNHEQSQNNIFNNTKRLQDSQPEYRIEIEPDSEYTDAHSSSFYSQHQ